MSLFQPTVLKEYLKQQDDKIIAKAYRKYTAYFHNHEIQHNIRISKEEQFQEGFLRELFVKVFGYIISPNPNFNLTTEFKNQTGARKADGAILNDGKAIAVIELKGTNTKDLESIRKQAFDYKANQSECIYVITSNFEKLRFYIHNAVEFEEFNLFTLNQEQFALLYLCLSAESIKNNLPQTIKEKSVIAEEKITKTFYADYSLFKRELFRDLVKQNMKNEIFRTELQKEDKVRANKNIKRALFKTSQKLIDRFLFIFFAEDCGLLPANSTLQILEKWQADIDFGDEKPLYEIFKIYFNVLDTGRKGTTNRAEIFAYNGGLFKPDNILNSLIIEDTLLQKHTSKLSAYDFSSQLDVNILGHIFENSLNEIESINAEIEGGDFDKQKSKRKKDGVFYTPKYITQYIVENTVGKLCEDKKKELGVIDEEYRRNQKGRQIETLKKLDQQLEEYRLWLLNIKICDPACGSGAFLNQALAFLIREHKIIDELSAALTGAAIVFPNIENSILENNIYGVDINEESVEIAKLSLWLSTAQPRRKLTSLNNNIKCGNSLIDDPKVAGEKAFNWKDEFTDVFEKGGFDVIIGNPPYVRQELVKEFHEYLSKNYKSFAGKADLFTYFYEKGSQILKKDGYFSFISSGKFFEANYGKPLIEYLLNELKIIDIINFDDLDVFKGISAYPLIYTAKKSITRKYDFNYCFVPKLNLSNLDDVANNLVFDKIAIEDFRANDYQFYNKTTSALIKKLRKDSTSLEELKLLPLVGIKTGYNDGFTVSFNNEHTKDYIFGRNIKRYAPPESEANIIFPYVKKAELYSLIEECDISEECANFLNSNKERLIRRAVIDKGYKNGTKQWFEYQQINKIVNYDNEYIIYPNVSLGNNFTLSTNSVIDMTGFIIPSNDKSLLALLNSSLIKYLMNLWSISRRGGYLEYKAQYLNKLPLKLFKDKNKIETLVIEILDTNKKLKKTKETFIKELDLNKIPKKLQNFENLTFIEFSKEYIKTKKLKFTNKLEERNFKQEWEDMFEQDKSLAQKLKSQINQIDNAIDQMVYRLYDLSEDEIKIVEAN